MMLFVNYDVTWEGCLALAWRYGSPRAVEAFLDRYEGGDTQGEALPVGAEMLDGQWTRRGISTRAVVCSVTGAPGVGDTVFVRRVGEGDDERWITCTVPARSDLDAQGRCPCGCAYDRALHAAEARIAFVDAPLPRFTLVRRDGEGRITGVIPLDASSRWEAERMAAWVAPESEGWTVATGAAEG